MYSQDITHILTWWLYFFGIGVISFPLSFLIFRKFVDGGWGVAKILGIILTTYLLFVFSIFKITPFTQYSAIFFTLLFTILNAYLFIKNKKDIVDALYKKSRFIVISEILFAFGLVFWSYVRAHQPDINGLEKFMDYGFVNTILRSTYLPPLDMWASGLPINYYWYGHYVTAFITKLLNLDSSITYNLMLATILGLALSSAFSISSTLLSSHFVKINRRLLITGALVSTLLLSFGGNFHTPFYVLQNGAEKYWYPDATRFIGYNPETNDKTIHEFPLYSYVVADLHGHLLNVPFVLLYIALLLRVVLSEKPNSLKDLVPLGLLLAIMFMTSTWDFGNYNILTGVTFGYLALQKNKVSLDTLFESIIPTLKVFALGIFFALPFIINFDSIAQGAAFVNARTPLWQLLILWGFPFLLTILFALGAPITKFFKFSKSDVFVLALLTTSLLLILLPEIVYVKDIYIASHHRANTMFKLTYQAFVMSYLASGYIFVRFVSSIKNQFLKLLSFLAVVFVLLSLFLYPTFAIKSYYGDIFQNNANSRYKGLNGEVWMKTQRPEEYDVIQWFKENVTGQPTILEAQGDSYTEFNVISSYTGLPTVNGWYVHEWLWRGSSDFPQLRSNDVQILYTSSDSTITKELLKKYDILYVIVGNFERQKYPTLDEEKWTLLGNLVFSSGSTSVYKIAI